MRSPVSDIKLDAVLMTTSLSSVASTSRLFNMAGYGKAAFHFAIGPTPATVGTLAIQATVIQATAATATPSTLTPAPTITLQAGTAATGANFYLDQARIVFGGGASVATGAAAWSLTINGTTFLTASAADASAHKFLASSGATSIYSLATVLMNSSHGLSSILQTSTGDATLVLNLKEQGDTYLTVQTNSTAFMLGGRFHAVVEVDADHIDAGPYIGLHMGAAATTIPGAVTLLRYQPRHMPVPGTRSSMLIRSSAS